MRYACVVLLCAALALGAGDLTGKWSGSFDVTNSEGETRPDTAYMDLKLAGSEVTGTAGPNAEKQMEIQKGRLEGDKLTFEVALPDGGLIRFALVFDGDTIKGDAEGTGKSGERMTAKLNLKRAA